jgi:hypothetical protein
MSRARESVEASRGSVTAHGIEASPAFWKGYLESTVESLLILLDDLTEQ